MKSFLKKISGLKNKVTRLNDDEPVTKLALAVIILLDIFILTIIFGGLEDHTAQLTSPDEYFPCECRQVFIKKDWTQTNKMDRLQRLVLTDYNNYSYRCDSRLGKERIARMHPLCREFFQKVRLVAEDRSLKDLFVSRQDLVKNKDRFVREYNRENKVYETKLLEKIADEESSKLDSMAASIKSKSREIERLDAQIKGVNRKINANLLVVEFWALARLGDAAQRQNLIDDLNHFEKVYLFRELMWQLLFLLPLLAVFGVWHSRSVSRERAIQSFISAHLIVVASIPIVFKVAETVLELIPFHFFKDLFKLLEKLHIIALWHYGVIVVAIGVAVLSVFIIQKKVFNRKRLYEKRLAKGVCCSCGKTLPDRTLASCPFCGAGQFCKCTECGADTYVGGRFCVHCGKEQKSSLD